MNHDINSTPAGLNQRVRLLKRRIGVISDNDAATAMVDSDAELLARAEVLSLQRRIRGFVEWPAHHHAALANFGRRALFGKSPAFKHSSDANGRRGQRNGLWACGRDKP